MPRGKYVMQIPELSRWLSERNLLYSDYSVKRIRNPGFLIKHDLFEEEGQGEEKVGKQAWLCSSVKVQNSLEGSWNWLEREKPQGECHQNELRNIGRLIWYPMELDPLLKDLGLCHLEINCFWSRTQSNAFKSLPSPFCYQFIPSKTTHGKMSSHLTFLCVFKA